MPAGRPTKYKRAYCQAIVEFMKTGKSATAFAASIMVCRETISEWAREHPEFSVALKQGKAQAAAWWEEQAVKVGEKGGNTGQATMITFAMKNYSGTDLKDMSYQEHTGPNGGPIPVTKGTPEEYAAALAAAMKAV